MKLFKVLLAGFLMLKAAYSGMPLDPLIHEPMIDQNPLRSPLSQPGTFARAIETDNIDLIASFNISSIDTSNGLFMLKEYGLNGADCNYSFLDIAAFFGSTKVFKYLILNGYTPTSTTMEFFSQYRHANFEIFKICENMGVEPSPNVLSFALNSLNKDLFCYVVENYDCKDWEYYNQYAIFSDIPCLIRPASRLLGSNFNSIKDKLSSMYPLLFEVFEKKLTSLPKIYESLECYCRLSDYPCISKINIPIFQEYSKQHFPEDSTEDAILRTMKRNVFCENTKLSFTDFSERLTSLFSGCESFIQNCLDATYDKSYEFEINDLLIILPILEKEIFIMSCFNQTFDLDTGDSRRCMIKFWKSWLKECGDKVLVCNELINDKIQRITPSYDVADFFEMIEKQNWHN